MANKKHCLIFLITVLVLLLGVGMVSATDTNNSLEVKDTSKLSTPSNYDVDKVVQSDVTTATSDADVEKITNTSDTTKTTTNTQTTNEDTKTITKTNEKSLKTAVYERTVNNYQEILDNLDVPWPGYGMDDIVVITLNPGTYTATRQIEITQYSMVKQLVINGNGQTINANGQPLFKASNSGVITLANLTVTNGGGNYVATADYQGDLRVDNCTFTNNHATNVIYGLDNNAAKLVVRNSTFEGNSGTLIYAKTLNAQITGNTFKNNDLGTGHVINAQSGVFNISKNVFHNNSANTQTCIILDELVTKADINNNTFTNNVAGDLAAVLYMSNEITTSNHTFTNNIILNNSAERGTVFGVNKAKNNIQISDNIIEYNTGMRKGVIVDVINGGTVFVLENNTIKYNYLPDGAVRDEDEDCLFYAMSGNLTLIGNDISENIGYGTSCMFNVDGTFCLFNNTINRNHFEGSSIIYMNPYGTSDPHIYLDHNTFDSNEIFETDEYHPYIINVRTHKDTGELRWYGHLVVTNNTFNNNTVIPLDSQTNTYDDILLSQLDDDPYNVRNHFIADNNYTNNALNTTNATITRNSSNATHYNITAEVYVLDYAYFPEHPELGVVTLDRYNTTVRNGTMRVTDKNGNFIGDFPVVNGTSEIILDKNEIAPLTVEDLVVTFISDYKHYQNYRGHILSVNADPKIQQQGKLVRIYGQYESYENGLQVQITGGDPNIAQRVSLYRSVDGQQGELVARYIDVSSGSAVVTISATLDEVNNYTGLEFIALYDNIEHEPLTAQAIGATNNAANQTVTLRIGSEVFSNTTDKNGYYEYWRRTTSIGEKVVHAYTPTDSATTTYYVTRARLNATAVPAVDRLNDKVMIYGYLDYVANFTYHVNVAGVNLRDNPYLNVTLFGGENDEGEGELLVSNVDIKENEFDLTVYVCNHDMQKYMEDPTSLTVRFTCNDTNASITPTLVSNYSANNSLVTVKVYDREYPVLTDDEGYYEYEATALEYGRTPVLASYHLSDIFDIFARTSFQVIQLNWSLAPEVVNPGETVTISGDFNYLGYIVLNITVTDPTHNNSKVPECTVNITAHDSITGEDRIIARNLEVIDGNISYEIPLSRQERNQVNAGTLTFNVVANEHDYYTVSSEVEKFYDPQVINFTLRIDGVEYPVKTDANGHFDYTYTANNLGKIPVIALYTIDEENDVVFSKNLSFNVAKITVNPTPSTVSLEDTFDLTGNLDYVSNVTLFINVTDKTYDDWTDDGRVNITIGDTIYRDVRVLHGVANVTVTLSNKDYNNLQTRINDGEVSIDERVNSTDPIPINQFIKIEYSGTDADPYIRYTIKAMEGISGKSVTLNISDNIITTTTVNANGDYSVTGLNVADYTQETGDLSVGAVHMYDGTYAIHATNTLTVESGKEPTEVWIDAPETLTVGQQTTVTFRLVNKTAVDEQEDNPGINNQPLTVTIGGTSYPVNNTDANGYTSVTFIPESNSEDITIVVNYDGNDIFKPSSNQATINGEDIELADTIINVTVTPNTQYINGKFTITGNLTLTNGTKLGGQTVHLTADGYTIADATTNPDGTFTTTFDAHAPHGTFTLTASFDGIENVADGQTNTTTFTVNKIPTQVDITTTGPVTLGEEITITATVIEDIDNPNDINYEGNFTFNINGNPKTVDVKDGVATTTYTPTTVGPVTIEAAFGENTIYLGDSDSTTLAMNPVEATLVIDNVANVYINQSATIPVHLQYNGVDVTDTGSITITIDDYTNTQTITNGRIRNTFTDYSNDTAGTKTITATYSGSQYRVTSPVTSTFEVNKVPTNVRIDQIQAYLGSQVDVVAYVNPTLSGYPNVNSDGTFTFVIGGGNPITVNVVDGVARTTYTPTTTDPISVSGTFAGDDYYVSDSDTSQIVVTDTHKLTDIVITTNATSFKVFEQFDITVKLTDRTTQEALEGKEISVTVTVDGHPTMYPVKVTNGLGTITVSYEPTNISAINITAKFNGDNEYMNSTNSTILNNITLPVAKLDVNVNKSSIFVNENIKIYGHALYYNDRPIRNQNVTISINQGEDIIVLTDNYGYYELNMPNGSSYYNYLAYSSKPYVVLAGYGGELDVTYNAPSVYTTYTVNKVDTQLDITAPNVKINETFDIVINLTNTTTPAEVINGKTVNVIVRNSTGETTYSLETVNGIITIPQVKDSEAGIITITATFESDNVYNGISATKEVIVDKLDTQTVVNTLPAAKVNEEMTITATVTRTSDDEGINSTGKLLFTVNGHRQAPVDVVNGVATITYTPHAIGELIVTAEFIGDDYYNPSSDITEESINVTQGSAVIMVVDVQNNTINQTATITVNVTVGDTKITEGTIIMTTMGQTYIANLTNGNFVVNLVSQEAGENIPVTITYAGINYQANPATTTLDIYKVDTTTTVTTGSNAKVNEELTITATVEPVGENRPPVRVGSVDFYVNDVLIDTVSITNGVATTAFTPGNNSDLTIKAVYKENDYYKGSEDTLDDAITVTAGDAVINVIEVVNNTIGKNASVRVNVTVGDTKLTDGKITMLINGITYTANKTDDGDFKVVLVSDEAGVFPVTVSYSENNNYTANNTTTNVEIYRFNTTIDIDITNVNVVRRPFNITVTLRNATNNALLDGKTVHANVIVDGSVVREITATTVNGTISFEYAPRTITPVYITATFDGDTVYNASTNTNSDKASLIASTLTINVTHDPSYINESVVITGKLSDEVDDYIPGAPIIISINDNVITTVRTNDQGIYTLVLNNENETLRQYLQYTGSRYQVKVKYDHVLDVTNGAENHAEYDIVKVPTKVTVNPITDDVYNRTTITITANVDVDDIDRLSDYPSINYEDNFTFIINGQPQEAVNVVNGVATIQYTTDTVGNITVAGMFGENDVYLYSENSTTIKVLDSRTPTNATIEVEGVRYAKEEFTAIITLKDTKNNAVIPNAQVTTEIIVNGSLVETFTNTTGDNGQYTIKFTPKNITEVTIRVTYDGNYTYKPCINSTIVKAELMPSTLDVNAIPNPSYVDQSVVIQGNLHDLVGNISGATINLYINGVRIGSNTTNEYGNYSYNVTVDNYPQFLQYNSDPYVVQAYYDFVLDVTNGAEAINTYHVIKMPTQLTIDPITDAKVNQTSTIKVTLKNVTEDGQPVVLNGKSITITVNGQPIDTTGKTTVDGVIEVEYTPRDNSTLHIVAQFAEDELYQANTTSIDVPVALAAPTLTCTAVEDEVYVDESVTITGKLTNGQTAIPNAIIKIFINDEEKTTVLTGADGSYSFVTSNAVSGTYTVKAQYDGIENILSAVNSTVDTYNVVKIPTTTSLELLNRTVGNVTVGIIVLDKDNQPVTTGQVDVTYTINGQTTTTRVNLEESSSVQLNIEEVDVAFVVSAKYLGTDKYEESQTQEPHLSGTAVKQNATITIEEEPNPAYVYEDITYTGTLLDGMGNPITGVTIKINVTHNGELVDSKDDVLVTDGVYTWTRHSTTVGELNVTAYYAGNGSINPVNASKLYTVNKRPTTTIVNIVNDTVGKTSITVQVYDALEDNVLITNGTLTVTVGTTEYGPIDINQTSGVTHIDLDIAHAGYISVIVKYNGNATYNESLGNITNITAKAQKANLTISNDATENTRVGDIVKVNGTLKDGLDQPMVDRQIVLTLDGEEHVLHTDAQGNYEYEYTTTRQGNFTAVATFIDLNEVVEQISNQTTFEVLRLNTTTVVTVANNTAGNVTIKVNVTDERDNLVTSGDIEVKVNGQDTQIVTANGTVIPVKLDINTNGTVKVTVDYLGDAKYNPSVGMNGTDPESEPFNNITVEKQNVNLTVGTYREKAPVTTGMLISGNLTDDMGLPIADATVTLTFNGTDTVDVTTNGIGYYSYVRTIVIPDNVTVVAYYDGSDKYNNATAKTSYVGEKLPTNTTVTIANNTVGNVSIDVRVVDKYHESPIQDGTRLLDVTVNGVSTLYDITGTVTNIPLDITTAGPVNVTVKFVGNYTYMESEGYDSDGVKFTEIVVGKQNATLSIVEGPSPVYVYEDVTYSGILLDGMGQPIKDATITIVVRNSNGDIVASNDTVKTDADGVYSWTRHSTNVGAQLNVTATYGGSGTVNEISNSTVYTVNKRPTTTGVTVVNDTVGSTSIDVTVKDALEDEDNILKAGTLTVTVGTQTINNIPIDSSGVTHIDLSEYVSHAGYTIVTVEYDGNDTYQASTGNITNITVLTQKANLTISNNATEDTRVGDIVRINGTLKDAMGHILANREITVTIDNMGHEVYTDTQGNYEFNYTTTRQGNFTATATFTSAYGTVGSQTVETEFEVLRLNTTTVVTVASNITGNVTINVNVTDERDNLVTSGDIKVEIEDQDTQIITANGTIIPVRITAETNGTIKVNVSYLGDDKYNPSVGMNGTGEGSEPFTNITVEKQNVTLTVGTFRDKVPVTTGMLISGYLTDAFGLPIGGAQIILTINGTDVIPTTTNDAGYYYYERLVVIPDNVTVVAYYAGSDKYNNATANTSYIGEKLPTNTTVTIANNTVGNVSIDVTVVDKFHYDSPITEGFINVTVDDETVQYPITGVITNIPLDITTTEPVDVKVEYIGNYTYLPSVGYDAAQVDEFDVIKADKQNATITINERPDQEYVFAEITYNGTLKDGMGQPIANAPIIIIVMHGDDVVANSTVDSPGITTDADGFYTWSRQSVTVGELNVTAYYAGNDNVNPVNASTTYTVNKRPTTTLVTVVDDAIDNVVIDVEVLDNLTGQHITNGGRLISVSILEGTYTYEITGDATRITLPISQNRKVVAITVRYIGNDTYDASTAYDNTTYPDDPEILTNITTKLHNTSLSIDVTPVNSSVGTVYTISGIFTDVNGTAIVGKDLIVRVNGTRYDVTTDGDGAYSVDYESYKEGNFTAEVEFAGDDLINRQTNNTTFVAHKIPTITSVEVLNNTVGNVTIGVNVTDENGTAITRGTLEITVGDDTFTERITGTQTPIDLDITTTDKVDVTVKYLGNDTYLESIGLDATTLDDDEPEPFTNITADKNYANIELEVIPEQRFVGENIRVIINLYDMEENPIRGPVNITIYDAEGNVISSENKTTNRAGIIQFTQTVDTEGNFTINASFESSVYNYTSDAKTYEVNRIPTTTTVDILNNTKGNVTISVRVNDIQNNVPLTEGELTLTVDGETKTVDITGETTTILINSTSDNIQISVAYPGDDKYVNSTGKTRDGNELTNITTVNTTVLITINADRPDIYVGEYITINGKVTLADNVTFVNEGYVIVTLSDGTQIRYNTPDEYLKGINTQYLTAGKYTATATYYDANDDEIVTSDELTFTVNKIPTITTVEILNNSVGNVTIDVVVRENVTDKYTAVITDGVINVTINGETVQYPIAGANTTIPLTQITENGVITVDVVYNGTAKYENSTARDKDNLDNNFTQINVTKIPTITSVDILNTTLSNVTIGVTVTNATGEAVITGDVIVKDATTGRSIAIGTLKDGQVNITIPAADVGEFKVIVEYQENDIYLASNATNSSAIGTPDENITVIDVTKIPTKTTVEILDNTLGTVTLGVKVTNLTDASVTQGTVIVKDLSGNEITHADLTDGVAIIPIPVDEAGKLSVIVEYQENNIYLASNATNESTIGTPQENITIIDVAKIPTKTSVEILDTANGNVTIGVSVTNMTDSPVTEGIVIVKDLEGNALAFGQLTDGTTTITIPTDTVGEFKVVVEYQENNIYLASNATNSSAIGTPDENITVIDVSKIPTKTTVEIINTTLGNVTIGVAVTNMTDAPVTEGTVIVKDLAGTEITRADLLGGVANITIPIDNVGEFKVIVEYPENNVYLASNATNSSAIGTPDENITVIDVTKIPTKTSVEILDNTFGNITLGVKVTNMTDEAVTVGTVVVKDLSGNEITHADLTDGVANITIDTADADTLSVIVEYQENDYYLASNATNSSAIGTPQENITVIDVNKIPTKTTVEILDTTFTNIKIEVTVTNMTDSPVTEGIVIVKDTEGKPVAYGTLTDGKATIEFAAETADILEVYVEYQENNYYLASNATNSSAIGTPEENITIINATKIPTKTTVEILDNTFNNVTIGVKVTNMTDVAVTQGTVVVKDLSGNEITHADLTDGVAEIPIPVDEAGKLSVIVEYIENEVYLASNATNESAIGTPGENITVIDVTKIPTITSVEIINTTLSNVTVGVTVTNATGDKVTKGEVYIKDANTNTVISSATLTDGIANITVPASEAGEFRVIVEYQENDLYLASNATNSSAIGTPDENITVIDVTKIPTKTTVEILDNTLGNVTLGVKVTNMTDDVVTEGTVTIIDLDGNEIANAELIKGMANITLENIDAGLLRVLVHYNENDVYLESYARNETAIGTPTENITVINVTKMPTITSVEIINTTLTNVTIGVKVTNETGEVVTEGEVYIKDPNTNTIITNAQLTDGIANITLPAGSAGEFKVIVEYQENDLYLASNATNSSAIGTPDENITVIDVTKIPTKTTVEVLNSTIGNVTLDVAVTNQTGIPVTEGTVIVKDLAGNKLNETTLTDGKATISVPIDETGNAILIVEYQENDIYLASNATNTSAIGTPTENITIINVTKQDVDLTVDVTEPVKAFENITINGTLIDDMGNPIPNADVEVRLDGEVIGTVTTDNDGKYTIETAAHAGEHTVDVNYPGSDKYNPATESKDFTVDKLDVDVDANVTESNPVNTTVEVNVTDEQGTPVDDVPVVIKDENGTIIGNGTVTDGTVNITVPLGPGDHNITIETNGTDDYEPTSTTIPVNVPKYDTELTVDPVEEVPAGEETDITGTLTDEFGNPIPSAPITVTVNGEEYPTTTDEDGNYEVTVPVDTVGENNVTVSYPGDDEHEPTEVNSTFNVGKIPTIVTVDVLNNTVGNVTVTVEVTNTTGEAVPNGTVVVKDMDGNIIATGNVTDGVTNITIPVDETGKLLVQVEYLENEIYLGGNATNESAIGKPTENITVIDVEKQDADLTVDVTEPVKAFEDITISGTLIDDMGNPIPNADVEVRLDGEVIGTVTTDEDGKYTIETAAHAGEHTVDVNYPGSDKYNPASESKDFTVDKLDVDVDANTTDITPENTTVQVNVTDEQGTPVDDVPVVIKDENGTIIGNGTVTNGTVNITVPLGPGDHNITIETNGTDDYEPTSTTIPVNVPKYDTELTVDPVEEVPAGEETDITGTLTDEFGNPIPSAPITVTVNGEDYPTTTDEDGNYEVTVPVDKIGENNVTVSYPGDDEHEPTEIDSTFNVGKIPTKATVEVLNNTVGNVTVSVTVTNTTGTPVTKGNVIVKDMDGNELSNNNLTNGVTNITIPTDETGKLLVQVEYQENDIYLASNATNSSAAGKPTENITVIDVDKHDSDLTVDVTQPVKALENITISGSLEDETGTPIPNAEVEVSVDGEVIGKVTTDDEGKYEINTTANAGEHTVDVNYPGDDTHQPVNETKEFAVDKLSADVDADVVDTNPVNTTVEVNVTDEDGNPVDGVPVVIKDENGTVIGNGTVTNGTVNVTLPLEPGNHRITVETNGTDNYEPSRTRISVDVPKFNATLTLNPIQNITYYYQTANITGKLTDMDGKALANTPITLDIDGVKVNLTTNNNGQYSTVFNTTNVGLNNVTASFAGNTKYNPINANGTYNASKIVVYVTVDDVKGTIGERITLRATVTDEYDAKVTGGQFVFKINGLTLRDNGKFAATGTPMILSPVNGVVTVSVIADNSIRSAKNVTGVYGETYKYYGARSQTPGVANIAKRVAQISVSTNSPTKQDTNLTLVATVTDMTHGTNNGPVYEYDDNFVIFKVNGITIKDADGNAIKAPVKNGKASLDYYVPIGLAGVYTNLTNKPYTVTAVFGSSEYYSDVKNTTQFNVERSPIHFNYTNVTLNTKSKELTVQADILDYHENLLKGSNTVCLKINGESYKVNNKTVYYNAENGKVNINVVVPYRVDQVNSIELVTGQRVGYLGGRMTTTDIIRV